MHIIYCSPSIQITLNSPPAAVTAVAIYERPQRKRWIQHYSLYFLLPIQFWTFMDICMRHRRGHFIQFPEISNYAQRESHLFTFCVRNFILEKSSECVVFLKMAEN